MPGWPPRPRLTSAQSFRPQRAQPAAGRQAVASPAGGQRDHYGHDAGELQRPDGRRGEPDGSVNLSW